MDYKEPYATCQVCGKGLHKEEAIGTGRDAYCPICFGEIQRIIRK